MSFKIHTFKIKHFLLQVLESAQGLYIPSVMQLIRMTIIVTLSNHLKRKFIEKGKLLGINSYGFRTILMQSRLRGLFRWRILNDLFANWGQLTTNSISNTKNLICQIKMNFLKPSINAVPRFLSARNKVEEKNITNKFSFYHIFVPFCDCF